MKLLAICGSRRQGSHNAKLLELCASRLTKRDVEVDKLYLKGLTIPAYDEDIKNEGFPADVDMIKERLDDADGYIIVSPEYNFSMPGHLKNLIDWLSRYRPQPFQDKHAYLMSASPGMVGGNRGLWALRIPLEALGSHVYPAMFSFAQIHQGLDDDGNFKDDAMSERLDQHLDGFLKILRATR